MSRIYLASSWRNSDQPLLVDLLREQGHEVYDFRNPKPGDTGFKWSEIDPEWQRWSPGAFRNALTHPVAESGFHNDKTGMDWADTCVLLLPCGRSAHLEAGYMAGEGKRVLPVMLAQEEPELMYKLLGPVCTNLGELLWRLNQARPMEAGPD